MREQLTPTSARRVTLQSPAGPLAGLDTGFRADRPRAGTVLLLPGYTGSKEDFAPILDPLCANGFRTVAIDLPGQFESPGPDDEAAYAPLALGEVCAAVIADLGSADLGSADIGSADLGSADLGAPGPVVLLGHSYGGLVARGAVLAGAPISGLILLCSGPAAFSYGPRYAALVIGEPLLRAYGKALVYEGTVAIARAARKPVAPDVAALLRRRFLESSEAGLLGMGAALQTEPDRVDELHRVLALGGTPVSVIAGSNDDAWPLPDQQDMAVRLGTELVIIDRAAHSPAVENPDGLLNVLLPLLRSWVPTPESHATKSSGAIRR